jgi:hypothetical protein
MKRLAALAAAAVLGAPAPALAAVCFTDSALGATYVLEIRGTAGRAAVGPPLRSFLAVTGEVRRDCGEFQAIPVAGGARLRADGKMLLGLSVPGSSSECVPYVLHGALDPPGFDSGTGFFVESPGVLFRHQVTVSPTTCPPGN